MGESGVVKRPADTRYAVPWEGMKWTERGRKDPKDDWAWRWDHGNRRPSRKVTPVALSVTGVLLLT